MYNSIPYQTWMMQMLAVSCYQRQACSCAKNTKSTEGLFWNGTYSGSHFFHYSVLWYYVRLCTEFCRCTIFLKYIRMSLSSPSNIFLIECSITATTLLPTSHFAIWISFAEVISYRLETISHISKM